LSRPTDRSSTSSPARACRPGALRLLAALVAASGALGGCNSPSHPQPAAEQPETPPILTRPGVATAAPALASIGAGGGSVSSPDGALTLTVPAGAVPSETAFSIEPITNSALGGVGGAFRLRPEGVAFRQPVTLVFHGPSTYQPGTSLAGLGVSYQDQSGFWFPVKDVARDAAANTLTVTTTHFSDWGVVWSAGVPGLYGKFTLTQTYPANVPFAASGDATLFYQGDSPTKTLYVLTGSVTESQISKPGAVCAPASGAATQTLSPSVAERWSTPSQFRWAINAQWSLTCTDASNQAAPDFMTAVFDTLGINLVGQSCARGYVGTPTIASDHQAGTYTIDCGARGVVSATWDFVACIPGTKCSDPALNPCHAQVISCDTGVPVCTDAGTPVTDGTSCGTYLACSAGACTCTPGVSCPAANACSTGAVTCSANVPTCTQTPVPTGQRCAASDACHTGTVTCDPVAGTTCTQTAVPDGTACGTYMACSAGVCSCTGGVSCPAASACYTAAVTCSANVATCTQTPVPTGQACPASDACHTGTVTCDPVAGTSCTQAAVPTGQSCPGSDACHTGTVTCDPVTGTSCAQAAVPTGQSCPGSDACHTGTVTCDPTTGTSCTQTALPLGGSCAASDACHVGTVTACDPATGPVCTQAALADGTGCGAGSTCNAGACVASRTVTGTRLVTSWPDAGAPVSRVAPDALFPATASVEALVPAGAGYETYAGSFAVDGSGSFSIPNVPSGVPYLLVLVDGAGAVHAWQTSADVVDLGYDVLGRDGVASPSLSTPVTLDLSWPDPWNATGDELQLTSSNVNVWDVPLATSSLTAGATATPAGTVEDWRASRAGAPLGLVQPGDAVWVHQLATHTATQTLPGGGVATYDYQAAAGATPTPLTTVAISDVTGGTIAAALQPAVATGSLDPEWHVSTFESFLGAMGPSAVASSHRLVVGAAAHASAAAATPGARGAPVLLRLTAPAGAPDVSGLGPLAWNRFLDATLWSEWLEAVFFARVSYTASALGATVPLVETATLTSRVAFTQSGAPTVVQPPFGPVTLPRVNGLDAFVSQAGVGLTPLLSWTMPAGVSPTSYEVTVYRLGVAADGITTTRAAVATFTTAATTLRVPANLLVAGGIYYARIDARVLGLDPLAASGTAPQTVAPGRAGSAASSASALTASFTP
jgi:hypothetical protein